MQPTQDVQNGVNAQVPTFTIVTPCFNAVRFINSTIASVVSQKGQFRIRYHVQDGGSLDGTVDELRRWKERLASGVVLEECCGIDFSYSSRTDNGMYDAIQTGFAHCGVSAGSYMSWINSDDIIMPGALSCAAGLFQEFPDIELLGGIPCQSDETGAITRIHTQQFYPQCTLVAGLHDGRRLPFVMQEGTFWRAELWLKTGGLNPNLRLAGDFDLWRRFSTEASYISVDTILAAHRRHPEQLTQDTAAYYAELDALMEVHVEARDREWERYQHWRARSVANRDLSYLGERLSHETGKWELERRSLPALFNTTICVSASGAVSSLPARYVSGFSEETDSYPHLSLLRGGHWLGNQGSGIVQFGALSDGPHNLRVRLRSFSDVVVFRIKHGNRGLFEGTLPITLHDRECEVSVTADLKKGVNSIELVSEPPDPGEFPQFLVTTCEATPLQSGVRT